MGTQDLITFGDDFSTRLTFLNCQYQVGRDRGWKWSERELRLMREYLIKGLIDIDKFMAAQGYEA